jgi:hypothetical protein
MIQLPKANPRFISPLSKWMRDDPSFYFTNVLFPKKSESNTFKISSIENKVLGNGVARKNAFEIY